MSRLRLRASTADRRQYEQDCRQAGRAAADQVLAAEAPIPHSDAAWNAYLTTCWADRQAAGEPYPPGDRSMARRLYAYHFRAGFAERLHESGKILRLPYRTTYLRAALTTEIAAALHRIGYAMEPGTMRAGPISEVIKHLHPASPADEEAILVAIGEVLLQHSEVEE